MALCISVLELAKVPTPVKSAETLGELGLPCVPPNRNERLALFSTRVAPGGKTELQDCPVGQPTVSGAGNGAPLAPTESYRGPYGC